MDFSAVTLTESQHAFRDEVRAFLDEQLTPRGVRGNASEQDASYDEGFQLAMGAKGWLWPQLAEGRRRRGTGQRVRQDPRDRADRTGHCSMSHGQPHPSWSGPPSRHTGTPECATS